MRRWLLPLLALALLAPACASSDEPSNLDEEWGMDGPLSPTPPPGKDDSVYRKGLLVNTDTTRTQVWTARNKWEDTSTTAAKKAGLAWSANSGLTWDQKYEAWIQSLPWTTSVDGSFQTVTITTPWGKTLPSPQLECAEMNIFLRITFAAWYELPFFMETQDDHGNRVFFGHNGVRTASGRYAGSPEFAISYRDYSASPPSTWPTDGNLRKKRVAGGDDVQPEIGDGASFGTYLDELHLNKRAGYFTVMALDYLGSMNLADAANAYNLVPDAVRPGDFLIERWQKSGIGHTLVVKDVTPISEGSEDIETISGSMPRRQGMRQGGLASKSYFTSDYTGGEGTNSDGDEYAKLGGGVKRWRVAKNIAGYWTNTWMSGDEASWINSTDYATIATRPARFTQLLGQVPPEQAKAELLAEIADARHHLEQYPASCSARENRERAFADLYDLAERDLGTSRGAIDAEDRDLADYVLGELDYAHAKTCCWDSSTSAMYAIVMDYANGEQAAADAHGECVAPTVFRSETTGYQRWADYAAQTGRAAAWKAWSEDETCNQKNIAEDAVASSEATSWCELGGSGGGCTDALEPDDARSSAHAVTGTVDGLRICAGDQDWLSIAHAGTVRIEFTHASGDLDLKSFDAAGTQLSVSQGTSDSETVTVPAGGYVEIYGYNGATNTYRVIAP